VSRPPLLPHEEKQKDFDRRHEKRMFPANILPRDPYPNEVAEECISHVGKYAGAAPFNLISIPFLSPSFPPSLTDFELPGHKYPHLDESRAAVVGDLYDAISESMVQACHKYSHERGKLVRKLPILMHDKRDFVSEPLHHYAQELTQLADKKETKKAALHKNKNRPRNTGKQGSQSKTNHESESHLSGRRKSSSIALTRRQSSTPNNKETNRATHPSYVLTTEEKNLILKYAHNSEEHTRSGHQVHDFGVLELNRKNFALFMSETMFAPTTISDKVCQIPVIVF
jgi:hypothetical protein